MKIFARWSDIKSVTVVFELDRTTLLDKLAEFRRRTALPAHLHILAGRSWVNPSHNLHVTDDPRAVTRLTVETTKSNLVSEPRMQITGASEADLDLIIERCREVVMVWGDGSMSDVESERIAFRADIELLRNDLKHNIRMNLNDDYLPADLGELRQFAARAGLLPDFDMAYPASALAARGGSATAGISTPAKRLASRKNGKRGGRPRKAAARDSSLRSE
jgi:hypothetical protein